MISGVFNSFASVTIIRILSRVLQFILRVYLIREVLSPQILAEMVALDLILTTALHITKSCFKLSYQQVQSKSKAHNVVSSMNLMSVGVLTTAISAAVVIFLQWHHKILVLYVNHTILMYGVCSIVEAIRQKYSVEFVLGYQYKKLAIIEFIGYLPKTLVIFVAAKLGLFQTYGILVFGVGQLVYYGICLLITFWLTSYKVLFITPFQTESKEGAGEQAYFDSKTKKILKELSYISLLKLFLQQFEKIVLVYQNTVQDSSIYSLVSNLGSIIVRFVFAPLEEIAYNYYARGTELESKTTLITLIKIILLFSVMCIGFGFRYAGNVLHLLYGEKWVSSESVLGFQCFMILVGIMGLNGTIDAFVMARADAVHTIPQLKYYTIISTGVYFGSSFVLLHYGLGAAGLFLGNSLGMFTKIIINWKIEVSKHIKMSEFLAKISPSPLFLFILFTSIFSSYQIRTRLHWLTPLVDFMLGVLLFGVCLLPLLYEYRTQLIGLIRQKILNKKAKQN